MSLSVSLLFHLNLSYSSIEVDARPELLERCYWPLLRLLEERPWLKLSLEASASTLEYIDAIDAEWIARLRQWIDCGQVEFIGSGDTQLIGPLVPSSVHRANQRLGQGGYRQLLGRAPTTALVNEMAWSQGIVDGYLEAGYRLLLMEWNNPRRAHPEWSDELRYRPVWTTSPAGNPIQLLWADAIAFQKFQRAVSGELDLDAYVQWVMARNTERARHLFLYSSDAEVFDFRPGRYATEPDLDGASEWERMGTLLDALRQNDLTFTTPAEVLRNESFAAKESLQLCSAQDPIPVKKQPKYNVTRWALTGRDDVGLNRMCFAREHELAQNGGSDEDWRELCRAWSSDLRTHLTAARWEKRDRLGFDPAPSTNPMGNGTLGRDSSPSPPFEATVEQSERWLRVRTEGIVAVFDTRRGLACESFEALDSDCGALFGTLRHGAFDSIDWAADFYSGHAVLEVPGRMRVADLGRVSVRVLRHADCVELSCEVPTGLGPLPKRVRIYARRMEFEFGFSAWGERPMGSLRAGMITLVPAAWEDSPLFLRCNHGGEPERFDLVGDCNHAAGVSPLITANAAFGASEGWIELGNNARRLHMSWSRDQAGALPLLTHRFVDGVRFCRLAFSVAEVDDTSIEGARLHDFCLGLTVVEGM